MKNIYVEFISERDLYQAYMPFLKNGGLFYKTNSRFELGTEVLLEVSLPDALESAEVKGEVCWLTPIGSQSGTPAGVGVSFVDDPELVKNQIEKYIARFLNSSDPTLTM
ncbi:PilZ domain-containing protein [Pseudocolwellia sp. AS88]|uniref:PilZ domain-containing protein n=1 Tax=Pseudocolwellia TaxID=2848177 RepID=UPI0026EB7D56|nr:PilZ domain-containing protein [Pseudocolwellia sp. AS88]MDO7083416.1 PilZ domain-containing protein [Pseudocolwellia sp. AS88]